jgi:mannose-1-phosphate guanylyltransferase
LLLADNPEGLFFVLNADIICDYPLTKMVEFHKAHGGEGTLVVTRVDDPSRYGVIVANSEGMIERFVEKPTSFVSNKINAGMYLFNANIIKRIPMKPTSIERETFPAMAEDKQLYQLELPGYWMDIGQPKDYVLAQQMYI